MVHNVEALHKLHIIDFSWRLSPFEPIFVAELHSMRHDLEASFYKSIFCKLWIVPKSEKGQRHGLPCLFLALFRCLTSNCASQILIVKQWSVKICLVVVAIAKYAVLARRPLQPVSTPLVLLAETLTNAIQPRV